MKADSQTRRSAAKVVGLGMGLVGLLLLWTLIRRFEAPSRGELSVTYVGLTNDVAGKALAQFKVENLGTRLIRFGVGSAQIQAEGGWPPPEDLGAGTGDWLAVAAGSNQVFSQQPPSTAGRPWRVPLIYQQDPPALIGILDGILGRGWRRPRFRFVVSPPVATLLAAPASADLTIPMDATITDESARRKGRPE